ncbi:anon-37Cs-like protein [Ascosphaera apis ARSEF 7405]|uniref:Anon-37Cs-like protein n=1 Tax=Ascosphaera apis ARSEF 7405 TaxID=392613 RepID=A0A167VIP8_9EURO|nr:anon-37Cs-like protein [Ascosphaera apis ARSEF 7405]
MVMNDQSSLQTVFPVAVNPTCPPSNVGEVELEFHESIVDTGTSNVSLRDGPAGLPMTTGVNILGKSHHQQQQHQLQQQGQRQTSLHPVLDKTRLLRNRTGNVTHSVGPTENMSFGHRLPPQGKIPGPGVTGITTTTRQLDSNETNKGVGAKSPIQLKNEIIEPSPPISNINVKSRFSRAISTPDPHSSNKSQEHQRTVDSTSSFTATNSFLYTKVRPKSSIPADISQEEYAQQCIEAAHASRLNPYALHKNEQELLQDHLCHLHVTAYLNIRNAILRLWTRNPMVSVTQEEALGCVRDARWMPLATFAYDWLVRNGYINFGCVEITRQFTVAPKRGRRKEAPAIVVVGAGMAGLGAARQLQGLFKHYDYATDKKVMVFEGRRRLGGRIYSQPLCSKGTNEWLPNNMIPTAEAGAHIVVGFDHGNPLDAIIRAQLALRYHSLRDVENFYDIDGTPVDESTDKMVENLYNDVLERAGAYRRKSIIEKPAEGDHDLINFGRDTFANDGLTIKQYEDAKISGAEGRLLPLKRNRRGYSHKIGDVETSSTSSNAKATAEQSAAKAALKLGWPLVPGCSTRETLNLDELAHEPGQTLGAVMDEAIHQYQDLLPLTPQHMRLFNWHYANLEYACGVNLDKLDLAEWDQDMGNEFEGLHAQITGGYQQVPRALWALPSKLDLRTNKAIKEVHYDPKSADGKGTIICEDGEVVHANKILITVPLGVLKDQSIKFVPPLPDWKQNAINRLGYGTMNKVILVFEKPFWDVNHDIFGILQDSVVKDSLSQSDYATNRGKFFLIWNCIKTSGLPVLIALMAGDTAYQAEKSSDAVILSEVMSSLRNVFKNVAVPDPVETIITRWGLDRFARGTYSHVAAGSLPGDYDLIAKPVGNLFFAGEATCGTHPATVHGAYISGLRAASEIVESVVGPIPVPDPLVLPRKGGPSAETSLGPEQVAAGRKRKIAGLEKEEYTTGGHTVPSSSSTPSTISSVRSLYDTAMQDAVTAEIGPKPIMPKKLPLNPFLLYQKFYWGKAREFADRLKQEGSGNAKATASRDEVRVSLGSMWRNEKEEIKKPYLDQILRHRVTNDQIMTKYRADLIEWQEKSEEVRQRWMTEHPFERFEDTFAKMGGKVSI